MSARSCDQLCPTTADHIGDMYTDHQGTDDQCALMICVAPAVPPASAHQCHINATFQCLPVHINATYQCPSELPFSVTHQCQSVPPINASQCHLSVLPISATYHQCRLSVCISATYQCPSVPPISAAYQCHI
ncbi:unnamed protein product [Staurois parvus]|uniref:Uncharacterized protein n=1 Tax=Staurois parvus TaxID=386267 RepID=A0ABN9HIU1_9NEOB|nr:unnamed protein product [Staurois parvus]